MGTSEPPEPPRQDPLLAEASLWFARMRGPEAETLRLEHDAWLARGGAHLGAYNRAAELFNMGGFLRDDKASEQVSVSGAVRRRWPLIVVAASAAVLIAYGVWFVDARPVLPGSGPLAEIAGTGRNAPLPSVLLATPQNKARLFMLADGSRVRLDGASRVTVTFSDQERALRLLAGTARFDVAHEPRRFIVFAGGGSVTAHGTMFDVSIDRRQQVTVRLLRGAVAVEIPQHRSVKARVRHLRAGEQVKFTATLTPIAALALVESPPPGTGSVLNGDRATTVWEFDNIKVDDLLTLAGKAGSGPRVNVDPTIGDMTVSGRFTLNDRRRLAERLALLFGLALTENPDGELRLRHR